MSGTKTTELLTPDGMDLLFMDHRLPVPASSDAGKPVVATGADTYGLGKRTVIHVCTATANTSVNAMVLDIAKSDVLDGDYLLVTFESTLNSGIRFSDSSTTYNALYRGGSFPDDGRCLNAGDTWMAKFANNTFNLLFRDREHYEDSMLGDGAFYPNAVQDYDGNWYGAVIIGNQVWLAENLRTTHYSDGTAIAYGGTDNSDSTPYYYHSKGQSANDEEYGLLYNMPAVLNGASASDTNPSGVQGIAPTGWHIPSNSEWSQLRIYVGKHPKFLSDGKSATKVTKAMSAVTTWPTSSYDYAPGNNPSLNNRTGFSAKAAGGMRVSVENTVTYDGIGSAMFMSSSNDSTNVTRIWQIRNVDGYWMIFGRKYQNAQSVRCVCDMTPYQFREWYIRTYGSMQHHVTKEQWETVVMQNGDTSVNIVPQEEYASIFIDNTNNDSEVGIVIDQTGVDSVLEEYNSLNVPANGRARVETKKFSSGSLVYLSVRINLIDTPYYSVDWFTAESKFAGMMNIADYDYGWDLNQYITNLDDATVNDFKPDKMVRTGTLTLNGVVYNRYQQYYWYSGAYLSSDNEYENIELLIPVSFPFYKKNSVKKSGRVPSSYIKRILLLTFKTDGSTRTSYTATTVDDTASPLTLIDFDV